MTDSPTGDGPSLEQRVAQMERTLAGLAEQVARLEAVLGPRRVNPFQGHEGAGPPTPSRARPALPRPAPPPAPRRFVWQGLDLEQLIGRYGAIGFALLALLTGVGTFVSWAARQGLLGPELRVTGGYLLGAVLGVVGVRLRPTRRTFANALLACALGCVHAASWGAGPRLQLLSSGQALAIVAVASAGLAWLALRESEDVLFLFGAGGAAAAPFVVSGESGVSMTLALYGALVFASAARGVGARPWHTAVRLVLWIVPAYLVALAMASEGPMQSPSLSRAIPTFAAGLWGAALLAAPLHAPRFVRWGAIGFLVASLDLADVVGVPDAVPAALALLATIGARLLFARADRLAAAGEAAPDAVQLLPMLPSLRLDRSVLDGILLPLAGLVVATIVTPAPWLARLGTSARTTLPALAGWGVVWAVGAVLVASREHADDRSDDRVDERADAWTITAVLSLALGALGLVDHSALGAIAYAVASSLALAGWWRWSLRPRAFEGAVGLATLGALLAAWELVLHAQRRAFGVPFTTRTSLGAALSLVGALVLLATVRGRGDAAVTRLRRHLAAGTAVFGFAWGLAELTVAWSIDLSNTLLTLYVGIAGAIAIGVGIAWREELARRAGLLLGGWCALRTFVLAGDVSSLPLRVGLYFLAAAIGLVMAWMYTGGRGVELGAGLGTRD